MKEYREVEWRDRLEILLVWGIQTSLRTAGETCFASLVLPLVEILKSNEIQKTLAPCREENRERSVIRRAE